MAGPGARSIKASFPFTQPPFEIVSCQAQLTADLAELSGKFELVGKGNFLPVYCGFVKWVVKALRNTAISDRIREGQSRVSR